MKTKTFLVAVLLGFTSIVTSCSDDETVVAPTSGDATFSKEPSIGVVENNNNTGNNNTGNNNTDNNNENPDVGNGSGLNENVVP